MVSVGHVWEESSPSSIFFLLFTRPSSSPVCVSPYTPWAPLFFFFFERKNSSSPAPSSHGTIIIASIFIIISLVTHFPFGFNRKRASTPLCFAAINQSLHRPHHSLISALQNQHHPLPVTRAWSAPSPPSFALLSCLPLCVRSAVAVTGVSKAAAVWLGHGGYGRSSHCCCSAAPNKL